MKTPKSIILLLFILCINTHSIFAQPFGSLNFSGVDNFVQVPENPFNIIGIGDFTIEAWIKGPANQNTHPMILSNRGTNGFEAGALLFLHDKWGGSNYKMLCLQINAFNYVLIDNGEFNGSLLDGKCHHVVVTRKNKLITYYIDGLMTGTRDILTDFESLSSPHTLLIGKDVATNNTFNGSISSEIRIWRTARTLEEIIEFSQIRLTGEESNLIACWDFTDQVDQTLKDKTGNFDGILGLNDSTITNDPTWNEENCLSTSLHENQIQNTLSIRTYPNPVINNLYIVNELNEELEVQLFNQVGELMLTQKINSFKSELSLDTYSNGVYLLVITQNKTTSTQRIVKI